MGASKLLKEILNIKEDYVETIPGNNLPDEDKKNLNDFLEQIKLNKGRVMSISTINCSNLNVEHIDRYIPGKAGGYSTGYIDDYEYYTKLSHYFIIHYRCYKKLEHKEIL